MEAVRENDLENVLELLRAGAGVNQPDPGDTGVPLHYAVHSSPAIVEALLAHGAEINLKGRGGSTALHIAAASAKPVIVELLIARGAELNIRDDEGKTPLACALEPTFYEKFMKHHGGGPMQASDFAEAANKQAIQELLRRYGGVT